MECTKSETAKALKRIRFFAKAVTFTDSESEGYTALSLNDLYDHIIDPNSHPCNKLEKNESKEPTPSQFLIGVCFNKCTEPTNHKLRSPKTSAKKETRTKRNVAVRKKGGLLQTGDKEKRGNISNKHLSSQGTPQKSQPSLSHYPRNNLLPETPRSWEIGQINDLTKFTRNGRTHQVLSGEKNEGPSHANPINQSKSNSNAICHGETILNFEQQNKVKDWRNYSPCNQAAYHTDLKTKGKSSFIKSSVATSTAATNNYSNNNNGTAIIVVRPPSDQQKVICENIKIIKCSESHIVQKPVNVVNLVKSLEKVDKSFMDLLEIKHEGNIRTGQMSATKGESKNNKITSRGNDGLLAKDASIHMEKADCIDSKNARGEFKNTTQEKRKHQMTTIVGKQEMSKEKSTTPGVNNVDSLGFDTKDKEDTVIGGSGDKTTQNIGKMHQGHITKSAISSSFVHLPSSSTEKSKQNNERNVTKSKSTDLPDSTASFPERIETVTQLFESVLPHTKDNPKKGCVVLTSDDEVTAVETESKALTSRLQELESSAAQAHRDPIFSIEKISNITSGNKVDAEDDTIRFHELGEPELTQRCKMPNANFNEGAGYRNTLEVDEDNVAGFEELSNSATATGSLALKENFTKNTSTPNEGGPIAVDNARHFELQGDLKTVPVCEITIEECSRLIEAKSESLQVDDANADMDTGLRSFGAEIHEKFAQDEEALKGLKVEGHYLDSARSDLVASQTISANKFPIVRVEKMDDHHFIANKKESSKSCLLEQDTSQEVKFDHQEMPEKSELTKSEEIPWKEGSSMCKDDLEGRSHKINTDLCLRKNSFKSIDEVGDSRQEISKDFTLNTGNALTGDIKNTHYINAPINENNQVPNETVADNAHVIEKSGTSACDLSPKSCDTKALNEPINSRLRSADLSSRNMAVDKGDTYVTDKDVGIAVACTTRGKRKRVLQEEIVMDKCDRALDNKPVKLDLKRKRNKQVIITGTRGRRNRPKRNVKRMKRYY